MSNKVRFVDNLKVGAYKVISEEGGINILNNIDNYVLTATGDPNTIQAESQLIFDGVNLGIGTDTPIARIEISDITNSDLILIKNSNTNQGIKVNNDGVLQLLEFSILPTAVEGGISYSGSDFWVGTNI
jgi:hypothetical protein